MALALKVVYAILEVLIGVACCVGNLLVIWAVWATGSLREPTFCFMTSLAIADFLVGALAVPMAVLVDGQLETSFHSCLFSCCTEVLLTQASVLMLLPIAVDRHLRVQIPLRYKRSVNQRRCWAVVGMCWLLAVALSFTPMFGWYNHHTVSKMGNSTTITCRFVDVIPMTYLVYFHFFGFVLPPLLVMCALYIHIFYSISQRLQRGPSRSSESHTYFTKERKLAKSLVLVLVLFAVGWLPLSIMNCVTIFGGNVPVIAIYTGIILSHANSAVNPIVYGFKVPKIRRAFLRAWRKCTLYWPHDVSQNAEGKDNSSAERSKTEAKSTDNFFDLPNHSEGSLHTT